MSRPCSASHVGTDIHPLDASLIASDDEYSLFAVVTFRRVHDEFIQKCRENKYASAVHVPLARPLTSVHPRFIVRDFEFSEDQIAKQKEELAAADTTEKELWTELLQISRTNFSEAFQILVHLKVLHSFVESVLRYGLPANFIGFIIKVYFQSRLALVGDTFMADPVHPFLAGTEVNQANTRSSTGAVCLSRSAVECIRKRQGKTGRSRRVRWGVPVFAGGGIL